ncbi:hypothetical protein [Pantoea sp. SM3]|nr:hypothetical protein [Pantoea sp. SM3]
MDEVHVAEEEVPGREKVGFQQLRRKIVDEVHVAEEEVPGREKVG